LITNQDVQHIARLARIELSPEEEKKFEQELSAILEFIKKLNEVNTEGVEPMTGGTALKNVMRPDEQIDQYLEGKSDELLKAAPEIKNGWIKVKAVFE